MTGMDGKIAATRKTAELHGLLQTEINPLQHATAICRLIAAGADVNAPDDQGLTPLLRVLGWTVDEETAPGMTAAAHDIIADLLRHGADLSARTPAGLGAEDLARLWRDDGRACGSLLREAARRADPALRETIAAIAPHLPLPSDAVDPDTLRQDLFFACQGGRLDDIRYILHVWPDTLHRRTNADSALSRVLSGGDRHLAAFGLLIAAGIDVDWQNAAGMTVLMKAARIGYAHVYIPALIAAGADETLKNHDDMTARDIAAAENPDTALPALDQALAERAAARQAQQAKTHRVLHASGAHQKLKL